MVATATFISPPTVAADPIATTALVLKVVDGDTIVIRDDNPTGHRTALTLRCVVTAVSKPRRRARPARTHSSHGQRPLSLRARWS